LNRYAAITKSSTDHYSQWQRDLLQRHQLDPYYLASASAWLDPLAVHIASLQRTLKRPVLVGVNGAQGSGKTTAADYLANALFNEHELTALAVSLDDFYLTRNERQRLAAQVHPLLATRGVPGTHDMPLLGQTLRALLDSQRNTVLAIPQFDKAVDERRPPDHWTIAPANIDVIILEGWCLGATSQTPEEIALACNALERKEDPQCIWRNYSNESLCRDFPDVYALIDEWAMLCAPSFDCVLNWRIEQERKLSNRSAAKQHSQIMTEDAVQRFTQHFERLTRHCLTNLPSKVNHLYTLDAQRRVLSYHQR